MVWKYVLLVYFNNYCMLPFAAGCDDCIAVQNYANVSIDAFPSLHSATKPTIDTIGTMRGSGWTRGGAGVEWEGDHGGCLKRPNNGVFSTTMAPP